MEVLLGMEAVLEDVEGWGFGGEGLVGWGRVVGDEAVLRLGHF